MLETEARVQETYFEENGPFEEDPELQKGYKNPSNFFQTHENKVYIMVQSW